LDLGLADGAAIFEEIFEEIEEILRKILRGAFNQLPREQI